MSKVFEVIAVALTWLLLIAGVSVVGFAFLYNMNNERVACESKGGVYITNPGVFGNNSQCSFPVPERGE